jgi:hypothetical protein
VDSDTANMRFAIFFGLVGGKSDSPLFADTKIGAIPNFPPSVGMPRFVLPANVNKTVYIAFITLFSEKVTCERTISVCC